VDTTELDRLTKAARVCLGWLFVRKSPKYTYSAASVAIRFLESLPSATWRMIRKIVLDEDHESVAFPECHGRGFIAICQDNPQLRVERSISLWKNVFPVANFSLSAYLDGTERYIGEGIIDNDRCPAEGITKAVGTWIAEAMALPSLGMPKDSFTLIIDGNPTSDHTSNVFRVVQCDVAWQAALDVCYT
jgi:hypothetical protein